MKECPNHTRKSQNNKRRLSPALLALIEKIEEFNKTEIETRIEDGLSICPHIIQEAPNES